MYLTTYLKCKNDYIALSTKGLNLSQVGGGDISKINPLLYPQIRERKMNLTADEIATREFLISQGTTQKEIDATFHINTQEEYYQILRTSDVADTAEEACRQIIEKTECPPFGPLLTAAYQIVTDTLKRYVDPNITLQVINTRGDGLCFYHGIYMYMWLSGSNDITNPLNIAKMDSILSFDTMRANILPVAEKLIKADTTLNERSRNDHLQKLYDINTPNVLYSALAASEIYNLNIMIIQYTNEIGVDIPLEIITIKKNNPNQTTGSVVLLQYNAIHFRLMYVHVPSSISRADRLSAHATFYRELRDEIKDRQFTLIEYVSRPISSQPLQQPVVSLQQPVSSQPVVPLQRPVVPLPSVQPVVPLQRPYVPLPPVQPIVPSQQPAQVQNPNYIPPPSVDINRIQAAVPLSQSTYQSTQSTQSINPNVDRSRSMYDTAKSYFG